MLDRKCAFTLLIAIIMATQVVNAGEAVEETLETASEAAAETAAPEVTTETVDCEEQTEIWQETYTYLSDTGESRQMPDVVEKEGTRYILVDVSYSVEPLTRQYVQVSETMLAEAEYAALQDIDIGGLHYALLDSAKEEWQETGRVRSVSETRIFLACDEIPETIDVESQDTFTGEAIYGALARTDTQDDGAAWREGYLSETVQYKKSGETWSIDINGETFNASNDSPWFEGCEQKLLEYLDIDTTFNKITGVAYEGDSWQDDGGTSYINVRVTGDCVLWRYKASYAGDIAQRDLTLARYINTYQSDAVGYIVTAIATYSKDTSTEIEGDGIQSVLSAISLYRDDLSAAKDELLGQTGELKTGQEDMAAKLLSQADMLQQTYESVSGRVEVYDIVEGVNMALLILLLIVCAFKPKISA